MKIGYRSDKGKKRELDEDSIVVVRSDVVYGSKRGSDVFYGSERDLAALLVVADGMGGHNAGEIASRLATAKVAEEIVGAMIRKDQKDLFETKGKNPLRHAIREANNCIYNEVKKHPEYQGMGTTITAAVVLGQTMYIGHVGDSRAYIIDERCMRQITTDHSLVQEMVDRGEITRGEARVHPRKNIITRAVGIYQDIDVATFKEYIYREDYLLICCDGLTDMVSDEDIYKTVLQYGDPQKMCDVLIKKANNNGGLDNISIIVAQFDELKSRKDVESDKTLVIDDDETRVMREEG